MHIGQKIKEISKSKGFTNKQLAEKLGIAESSVYNIFSSKHLNTETLEKLSDIFGISLKIDFILNNDKIENVSDYNKNNVGDTTSQTLMKKRKSKRELNLETENKWLREQLTTLAVAVERLSK